MTEPGRSDPGPKRENLMLTKSPHLFDDATRITAGNFQLAGLRPGEDYWAFVGQFGGATAATILRALIEHPQRSGDPLALTVNYCAPVQASSISTSAWSRPTAPRSTGRSR